MTTHRSLCTDTSSDVGDRGAAEDLTSETFWRRWTPRARCPPPITVPRLIGVARHKLADHRRRSDRFTVPVATCPNR
jgi:RNA polymerase sigma-70 factor (ECF subfamily)